jgi:ribosomal protein S3AE
MAKSSKKRSAARTGLKWKRKKWYKIAAPKIFNNKVIGEAFAETTQSLLGRTVEVNLMQLTGNIKKQNLVLKMKTNDVKDEVGQTTVMEFYMQPASIKRFVRKGTTKIDESFCCYTKDKVLVRIKPLLLTRSKAKSSVSKDLRDRTRSWLTNTIVTLTFENFINDLCLFKIQRDLKTVLDKIYPLKACQIRKANIETRRKVAVVEPTGKEEKVERKKFVKRKPDERKPFRKPAERRSEPAVKGKSNPKNPKAKA